MTDPTDHEHGEDSRSSTDHPWMWTKELSATDEQLVDALPRGIADRAIELYEHQTYLREARGEPPQPLTETFRDFVDDSLEQVERIRRRVDARNRLLESDPAQAIYALYPASERSLRSWFDDHTYERPVDTSAIEHQHYRMVEAKDAAYFQREIRLARFRLGAIQVYAETCQALCDREIPDDAYLDADAGVDGVILPFTSPDQSVHAFTSFLHYVDDALEGAVSADRLSACAAAYADELDSNTRLVAVANTSRLPVVARSGDDSGITRPPDEPPWLQDLGEIVVRYPGGGHRGSPFERHGDWNPFDPRTPTSE